MLEELLELPSAASLPLKLFDDPLLVSAVPEPLLEFCELDDCEPDPELEPLFEELDEPCDPLSEPPLDPDEPLAELL